MDKKYKDIKLKEKEYEDYINEHVNNVKKAYNERKIPISVVLNLSNDEIKDLENRIENHDNSKWSDEEFDAYRRHFHYISDKEKEESKEDFEKAWKHHYTVNDHHPEHYCLDGEPKEIPKVAMAELICDWDAMSRKFGGNPLKWYNDNAARKFVFNDNTKELLEKALKYLYDVDIDLKGD